LISIILNAANKEGCVKTDSKLRINQLKNEVFINLTKNLLPYWSARMIDHKNGGFYGLM
jgi:mannose/cellobiose epimerase-like protein (N-acyl-D-glucosamine 2-epimerase family)